MATGAADSNQRLNKIKLLSIIEEGGPLSRQLKSFESRPQQKAMLGDVVEAYNENQIALIEAGTGTGKSVAYLVPALISASLLGERTVIATHTIALQEQLIYKDIPLLIKTLGISVKAVLAKGMGNYVCLRKLAETKIEILMISPKEAQEVEKIDLWSQSTHDGSRQSLDFTPSGGVWEKVCAEHDTCNNTACPYYQDCFFMRARRSAADAQIIVANHHLLFADVVRRSEEDNYEQISVLPPYERIVIDEAHHLEDIATDFFAAHLDALTLYRTVSRLFSERPGGKAMGKLPLLREKLQTLELHEKNNPEVSQLVDKLTFELPSLRKELLDDIQEAFNAFEGFILAHLKSNSMEEFALERKLRLFREHLAQPEWNAKILPAAGSLITASANFLAMIYGIEQSLKAIKNDKFQEQVKGIIFEIKALTERLRSRMEGLKAFLESEIDPQKVRWMEIQTHKGSRNTHLIQAELEIDRLLAEHLFSRFSTIILCSATLSAGRKFDYIRKRLGLTQALLSGKEVVERVYDSPFNFSAQALLAIPRDLPQPSDSRFLMAACNSIWDALQASRGNAFVLFTSYQMLRACVEKLQERLKEHKYPLFKQGDESAQAMLQRFKTTEKAVLFGTDSFWEGVDVVGEALRCVIIVKLPFKVPSEPLIQARTEAIVARGGDPFTEYSLPQAVMKFKQGFGRLVRHQKDRGCVVCLDSRILGKRYGQEFLNSLPDCQQAFIPSTELFTHMQDFYRRTYHLTKGS